VRAVWQGFEGEPTAIENREQVWYNGNRTKCYGQDWITRGFPAFPHIRGIGRNNSVYSLLGGFGAIEPSFQFRVGKRLIYPALNPYNIYERRGRLGESQNNGVE
jgi:hypothetical protein